MYVVSKVVLGVVPPFVLLTSRLLLGSLVLGVVIAFRPKERLTKRQVWQLLAVGVVGYGVSLGFQFVGTRLSTASNGALVTSATPVFVLLFAPFLLGEKATPRRVVAMAIATLGVLAVIDPRTAQLSSSLFVGNLCLLAAALTWALYSVLVRRVTRSAGVLVATAIMFLGGLPVGIPVGLWEIGARGIGTVTPGIVAGVLFIGIVCTAVAMFLWNYAFSKLPAAAASLTFFAQPVVGTLLGWFFLGEAITPLFLVGGVLIGIGILVANR
jgi:drug/metabolite transporter (DMT)-like permease